MPLDAIADALDAANVAVIDTTPGTFAEAVEQAAEALHASGAELYTRGGTLVRPVRLDAATEADGVRRAARSMVLRQVDSPWLTLRLAQAARWTKRDARSKSGQRAADPPRAISETIIAASDDLGFRPLRAVVSHPVVLPDGRIIDTPGYDAATSLLLDFEPGAFRPIPRPATKEDAIEALGDIERFVRHFKFASLADRAVALSLFVTPLVRPALDAAPMHVIDSPTAGSGKSLLVNAAAILATGAPAAMASYGHDEAEAEKRLAGMMLAGDSVVCIDNVSRPLAGDFLCALLTSGAVRVRPLGASALQTVPTTAFVAATGNNIIVRGDLCRRVLTCRVDPAVERPETRAFDQNLLREATERRAELVRAGITILAAYVDDGRPDLGLTPLGSFEAWSAMVRAALVYAGAADPVETTARARDDDPEALARRAVFATWFDAFGRTPTKASAAIKSSADNEALRDALLDVAPGREGIDPHRLGNWLKAQRDKVAGGIKLLCATPDTKSRAKWMTVWT